MYQPKWLNNSAKFSDAINQLLQHPQALAQKAFNVIGIIHFYFPKKKPTIAAQIIEALQSYSKAQPGNIIVDKTLDELGGRYGYEKIGQKAYANLALAMPDDPFGSRSWRDTAFYNGDWPSALRASNAAIKADAKANWFKRMTNHKMVNDRHLSVFAKLKNKKYKGAEKDCLWLRKHKLLRPSEDVYLANIHLRFNQPGAAEADLQRVKNDDRGYKKTHPVTYAQRPDFYSLSALVLWRMNKNKGAAQKLFDKALNITPTTYQHYVIGKVYADYAVFLAESGQSAKAKKYAAKAKKLGHGIDYGALKAAGL